MTRSQLFGLFGAILSLAASAVLAAEPRDSFVFSHAGRSVTVWYFVPPLATPESPVVMVMHGVGRNGEDYLNDWIPHARERGFVLVVPEFSTAHFPGVDGYNYGGIRAPDGRPAPREQWSFSLMEPIFDAVRSRLGNRSPRYRLYGHSAGAQFVHRFIFLVPTARVERVIIANSGWYTLPDFTQKFPYGWKDTPVTPADLRRALALPVVVLLGTADIDPNAKSLRHTPEAEAQGPHRLARGKYFFARVEAAVRGQGVALGWKLAFAPGIAHSDRDMAAFAVKALFSDF